MVESVDGGRKSSVQTEDLSVDEGGQREAVKQVGEVLPHARVAVLSQTLVVEPVHLKRAMIISKL